jgi:hypothetical protein
VDDSTLRPGKIYTYYVAACYNNEGARYLTMNSRSSTVVWGIPQLPEETTEDTQTTENSDGRVASIFGEGSLTVLIAMAALCVAMAAIGMTMASKKKKESLASESEAE